MAMGLAGVFLVQTIAMLGCIVLLGMSFMFGDLKLSLQRYWATKNKNYFVVKIIGQDNKVSCYLRQKRDDAVLVENFPYRLVKKYITYEKGAPTLYYTIGNPMPINMYDRGYEAVSPEYFGEMMKLAEVHGRADAVSKDMRRAELMFWLLIINVIVTFIILVATAGTKLALGGA